jgi:hypothetical protein
MLRLHWDSAAAAETAKYDTRLKFRSGPHFTCADFSTAITRAAGLSYSNDMKAILRHVGQLSLACLVISVVEQRQLADWLAGHGNTVILRRLERDLTRNFTRQDPASSAHLVGYR